MVQKPKVSYAANANTMAVTFEHVNFATRPGSVGCVHMLPFLSGFKCMLVTCGQIEIPTGPLHQEENWCCFLSCAYACFPKQHHVRLA